MDLYHYFFNESFQVKNGPIIRMEIIRISQLRVQERSSLEFTVIYTLLLQKSLTQNCFWLI